MFQVVSVLLILVAVTLLVLGLAGGSSTLLIGSIVASLLAAVALVIGARQAASQRRAAMAPDGAADLDEDPSAPGATRATAGAARSRRAPSTAGARTAHQGAGARSDFSTSDHGDADSSGSAYGFADLADQQGAGPFDADDPRVGAPLFDADDPRVGAPLHDADDADSRPSGFDDGDAFDAAGAGPSDRDAPQDAPGMGDPEGSADEADVRSAGTGHRGLFDGDAGPGSDAGDRPAPDYDRASSVIGSARSGGPADAWRRDPAAEAPPVEGARSRAYAEGAAAADAAFASGEAGPASAETGDGPRRGEWPPDQRHHDAAAGAEAAAAGEEFAEPDDDDPADEPLPQAVRPGDAVQVARMDAEVLVVDGRPRYHLADCHHLIGKLTESLPAREAVELGFSPCGLCRPVDRLVAQTARR